MHKDRLQLSKAQCMLLDRHSRTTERWELLITRCFQIFGRGTANISWRSNRPPEQGVYEKYVSYFAKIL